MNKGRPRIAVYFDGPDAEYEVRKHMYDYDKIDAVYFVDGQMDLDLDYGNVVISAHTEHILQLGKRIIELTIGAYLSDNDLQQLIYDLDGLLNHYKLVAEMEG